MLLVEKIETDDFYKTIGENIASARKDVSITQEILASRIGLSQPVLASYECGRRKIPIPILVKISECLNVYIEDLIPVERKKRGPVPKLDRELAKVKSLPKKQQQLVTDLIRTIIRGN